LTRKVVDAVDAVVTPQAAVPTNGNAGSVEFSGGDSLRKPTASTPSILLLGLMAGLTGFGVDMALPATTDTAASLGASANNVGLAISVYMASAGTAPLIYGPVSDRVGRKPIVMLGCVIFILGGMGCALAPTLPILLACRVIQGLGAASMSLAMAIAHDAYDDAAFREKMSYIIIAICISSIIAPIVGAAVRALAGWRAIYASLATFGAILMIGIYRGLSETPRSAPSGRLNVRVIVKNYARVLSHPACRGYLLAGSASFGVIAAYITGASLFFAKAAGMSPSQYSLIFGFTSLTTAVGALLDSRLAKRGVSSLQSVSIGFSVIALGSAIPIGMALASWTSIPIAIGVFAIITFTSGAVSPGILQNALRQLPQMSGTIGAASNCITMVLAALSSGFAAIFFDGRTLLSTTAAMLLCSTVALLSFVSATRREAMHSAGLNNRGAALPTVETQDADARPS
jgi:DHA1 family bicyclomycin/chloramphenicol resistance-like MFS transporter